MSSKIQYWTEEQKNQLLEYVKLHQTLDHHVRWVMYSNEVQNRTRQQCKAYYNTFMKEHQISSLDKWSLYCELANSYIINLGNEKLVKQCFAKIDEQLFNKAYQEVMILKDKIHDQYYYILQYPLIKVYTDDVIQALFEFFHQYQEQVVNIYEKIHSFNVISREDYFQLIGKVDEIMKDQLKL